MNFLRLHILFWFFLLTSQIAYADDIYNFYFQKTLPENSGVKVEREKEKEKSEPPNSATAVEKQQTTSAKAVTPNVFENTKWIFLMGTSTYKDPSGGFFGARIALARKFNSVLSATLDLSIGRQEESYSNHQNGSKYSFNLDDKEIGFQALPSLSFGFTPLNLHVFGEKLLEITATFGVALARFKKGESMDGGNYFNYRSGNYGAATYGFEVTLIPDSKVSLTAYYKKELLFSGTIDKHSSAMYDYTNAGLGIATRF